MSNIKILCTLEITPITKTILIVKPCHWDLIKFVLNFSKIKRKDHTWRQRLNLNMSSGHSQSTNFTNNNDSHTQSFYYFPYVGHKRGNETITENDVTAVRVFVLVSCGTTVLAVKILIAHPFRDLSSLIQIFAWSTLLGRITFDL